MTMDDDEIAWQKMLRDCLKENILPLLHPSSLSNTHTLKDIPSAVEQELKTAYCNKCAECKSVLRLPTDCDILSVKMLFEKFTESFRAEIPKSSCECSTSQDDVDWCNMSCIEPGNKVLATLPVVMIGLLKPGTCGLTLVDTTGQIDCEVSSTTCCLDSIGRLVVLSQWNYIRPCSGSGRRSKPKCYIEVNELIPVDPNVTPPPGQQLFSIASLKDSMRKKELPSRTLLSVSGRVRSISEVFRQSNSQIFLLELEDTLHPHIRHCVINQVSALLHLSSVLKISEEYVFTDLRDKVLNKGTPNEQRVLVFTDSTHVYSYHSPLDQSTSQLSPPPTKKTKISHSQDSSQMFADDGSVLKDVCTLSNHLPLSDEEESLLSYKGVISSCISPEAGVYEIDGRIRLYLTHQTCLNQCRALRLGASIELYNVHMFKITAAHLKHLSGFYCCPVSTVRLSHFSKIDFPFRGYDADNRLAVLLRRYKAMDAAWMIDTYLELRKRGIAVPVCFSLIQSSCQALSLPTMRSEDICSQFLTHPHSCQLLSSVDLSIRPLFPRLGEVSKEVSVMASSKEFNWIVDFEDNQSMFNSGPYSMCGRWSYGVVRHPELTSKQYLVGELSGSKETGYMELVDGTGKITVACTVPQQPPVSDTTDRLDNNVLGGFQDTVMISDFDILFEKTDKPTKDRPDNPSEISFYIHAKEVFVPPKKKSVTRTSVTNASSASKPPAAAQSPSSHSVPVSDKPTKQLMVQIINKNQVLTRIPTKYYCFTAQAFIFTNDSAASRVCIALNFPRTVFHLYSFINNGCLYELTLSNSELPLLSKLVKDPVIVVTEKMRFHFINNCSSDSVLDADDVLSMNYLPSVDTVTSKREPTGSYSRSVSKIISLKGTIVKRGYRIDHETLPRPLSPTLSTREPSFIVVFTVQSLTHPDTIMIYCKCIDSLTLGLLPGCVATFNSFSLTTSRAGNMYCVSCASSSITVNSLDGLQTFRNFSSRVSSRKNNISLEMASLPTTFLSELTISLVGGCLSRRIVCVRGRIVSVQRVSMQYKCKTCQCITVNGQCMEACLQRRHALTVDGRLIIDDGSGEAHVYTDEDLLRELLMVPVSDWRSLCDLVRTVGEVVYNKPTSAFKQVGSKNSAGPSWLSTLKQAKDRLSDIATNPGLQRPIKLYCQPFLSQAELKECILGQKSRLIRLKKPEQLQLNTLVLPRLQLRTLAYLPLDGFCCVSECRKLLELMSPHL